MGLKLAHIDMGNTEAATAALNLFAEAAERAVAAIDALGKAQHGGVTVVSMGDVAKLDVKPTDPPQDVILDLSGTLDPTMKAWAAALLKPMIEKLQNASKAGVNIVAVRYD